MPLYFLIGGWGHGRRVYAATKFFLYTMFGSAFMLVSHRRRWRSSPRPATAARSPSTSSRSSPATDLATNTGRWLFLGFAIAFAVKMPVFPFHTWLPDAHTEAPTAGSVDLAGVLLKLGTYGFLRFGLYLFPEASVYFAPLLMTLGVIGIIYGGIVATMQKDLKRLVAYSSVAHMGFVVLGLFALNTQGVKGSVLQMVNHGITTGALFILVGFIYERRHTYEISELKGSPRSAPGVRRHLHHRDAVARSGCPGLNGFVGEFLIAARHVRRPPLVGRGRRRRRDPRRPLPAVGLPAGLPRRARRGQRDVPRPEAHRGPGDGAAARADRLPRPLPEADARAHRAVGRPLLDHVERAGRPLRRADHPGRLRAGPDEVDEGESDPRRARRERAAASEEVAP